MDNEVPLANNRSRTDWTPSMDHYFIDLMLEQVQKGQKSENRFTKNAWMEMTVLFNKKYGLQVDKEVLKNRYKKLRAKYTSMNALLDRSGFVWDDAKQMVTADEVIWDDYLKAHPEAKSMRTTIMPNYNDLHEIYANTEATGKCIRPSKDADTNEVPQSLVMTVAQEDVAIGVQEESTAPSDVEIETPTQKRKWKWEIPSTSQQCKKVRKSIGEGIVDALTALTSAITALADSKADNFNSIKSCNVIEALEAIPDLDEDLYFDACDLLEDERKAKIFVALDVPKQRKWLLRKLRPNSIC